MEQAADILKSQGALPSPQAEALAVAITDRVANICGGDFFYFPKGRNSNGVSCFQLAERDWGIYREYNGTNRQALCDRYQISPQRLYQIISACRRHLAAARHQDPAPTPTRATR